MTELVMIGIHMNQLAIEQSLDQCLLTEEEIQQDWALFKDPIPPFNVKLPVNVNCLLPPKQQTTIATFSLTSSLPHNQKGTNMSRFMEQLEQYRYKGFTLNFSTLHDFARELSQRLEQKDTKIEVNFPWFYERTGPSSELTGLNHAHAKMVTQYHQESGFTNEVALTCGITTLCPCSKEISEYGAHN